MAPSSSQPSGSGHAPTESEHLPLLPRRRAQENHRLLRAQPTGPSSDPPTDRQSVAFIALSGLVSYFVSFPSPSCPPSPSPCLISPRFVSPRATSVSFILDTARAPRFSIFAQMARAGQKDHLPPAPLVASPRPPPLLSPSMAVLSRVLVSMKSLACDKPVNRKSEPIVRQEGRHVPGSTRTNSRNPFTVPWICSG